MKLVCVDTKMIGRKNKYIHLTIGKIYSSISDFRDRDILCCILDDNDESYWYPKKNFKPLDEVRQNKLEELGL